MSAPQTDRLEMRLPPPLKERFRRAAEAQGKSLTGFAIEALIQAANEVLDPQSNGQRALGWAAGTARELGDIIAPASGLGDWEALKD